jgi:oligosaccharide reducing-end xylanase
MPGVAPTEDGSDRHMMEGRNALLGFGLPASTGKPFVDKLWSTTIPKRDYWNGVLYMLAMLHVSGNFHLWY